MDEPRKHYAMWKKSDTYKYILYNSICMKVQNRQIHTDRREISGCQDLKGGGNREWGLKFGVSFGGDEMS